MSTVEQSKTSTLTPLVVGQRLDQPTFHERYEAMPPETKAELVGGVVYMSSPLGDDHGEIDNDVSGWLFHYKCHTPGVRSPNNATVKLDRTGESQPDTQLRIPADLGGQVPSMRKATSPAPPSWSSRLPAPAAPTIWA